jgi:hypothetical protein
VALASWAESYVGRWERWEAFVEDDCFDFVELLFLISTSWSLSLMLLMMLLRQEERTEQLRRVRRGSQRRLSRTEEEEEIPWVAREEESGRDMESCFFFCLNRDSEGERQGERGWWAREDEREMDGGGGWGENAYGIVRNLSDIL